MVTAQARQYYLTSQQFLEKARLELANGELQQASEKGWGAAVQMLKAIAEQRGGDWEHGRHRHFSKVASRLRSELGNRDLYRYYRVAEGLHSNFYEGGMTEEEIAEDLQDIEQFLELLEPLIGSIQR